MTSDASHVLVVDDDPHIREIITISLEDAGMTVTEVENGQRAVTEVSRLAPDMVIMDVGMPELDGFDACRAIRRHSAVPLLFLTARDEEVNRVVGFELGADDYVCKPFSPRELVLRVRAILDRAKGPSQDAGISAGDLAMEPMRHLCTIGGTPLDLTGTEFSILRAFLDARDRIMSRDQLIRSVYGDNNRMSDRTIDSHIRNIRQKAAQLGYADVITTVHGVGLKLGSCRA